MAKYFSDAINEIMPLVKSGLDMPFIISRDGGNWNVSYFKLNPESTPEEIKAQATEQLASLREKDPYLTAHTGADFADGSFAYVYDKVICARLRAEYNAIPFGELHGGELQALINLVEDNISMFSQASIDYLMQFNNPLRELYDINPLSLHNRDGDNSEPYLEEKVDEFFEIVEYQITERTKNQASPEVAQDRAKPIAAKGDVTLTADECLPGSKGMNYKGKLLIVDPETLLPEFRLSTSQLVQCTHGNGATPDAIGTSVFGREIHSGNTVVYGRHQILGIADNDKLPKWAQNKVERDCVAALDTEISAGRTPGEMAGTATYDLKGTLERLNFDYGSERVAAVLAAIVTIHDYDGRYSHANKQWAAQMQSPLADIVRRCEIKTHPVVLNGLVDRARENTAKAREAKPDLLAKISSNKQKVEKNKVNADTPTKKKDRSGQEV